MIAFIRRARPALCALAWLLVFGGCSGPNAGSRDSGAPPDSREPDPVDPPEGEARFYHLDVGQADATLVWGPDGAVLIDAGDWSRSDVVPHLESVGIERIDLLILTHPHADHIGQVTSLLRDLDVTEVWMTGWEHESQTYERALDAILASDAGYHEPRAGERQVLGDLLVEVLNPDDDLAEIHDGLAVRIRFGNFAAIYTGDAEAAHEREMLQRHNVSAPLLQLGHHGSRTSSSLEFLQEVDPEIAIYSAASDSQYNHPHPDVIERLGALGITTYGTPTSGTIVVTTDGEGYDIEELGGQASAAAVDEPATASADDCIDINRAEPAELEKLAHTGPARARQIVELRPFASVADLDRVDGLGEARVQEIVAEGLACVR